MAPSRDAGHASFEMDSGDEFSGVYGKKLRVSSSLQQFTRECLPMPTADEFSQRSHNKVNISDFENMDTASSDDETLIFDSDILADLPPKNQWPEHLVEYPVIAFIDAANVNRLLNGRVM